MTKDAIITLSINEAGTPLQSTFLFTVMVDGDVVASNQSLSPDESKAVRDISRRYNALFEGAFAPKLAAEKMAALGAELFGLWLGGSWEKIRTKVAPGSLRLMVIASDLPDVLNLPWELVHPPEGDFLGVDSKFSIRRFPRSGGQIPAFDGELRPPPLRLLLAVSSPTDLPTLDYEREEEYLLRAISGLDVAFDSADLGSFQDLRNHVEQFQPHVVHLTGHGTVGKKCPWCGRVSGPDEKVCRNCLASLEEVSAMGHFAFEDESGRADMVSSEELGSLMALNEVQCVFVSGCETGKAPPVEALGGVCQGLVSQEVPLAIGWAASISDDVANDFAHSFYRSLANGRPVDRALVRARRDVWKSCEKRGDPSWTLPVLYSATDQGDIFDLQKLPVNPPRQRRPQLPLPGMVEGYAEQFIGRRREQQRLLAGLRDGSLQTVIITGLGGGGKSSLATRLARALEGYDFEPIPIPSSREKTLNEARLIQIFGDAFLAADLDEAFHKLNNLKIPTDARLRYAITILNNNRFLLVLDNFESNLDEAKRSIINPKLAEFYEYMLESLTGSSRAIVTSRYLPAGELPPTVREENLGDFGETSFSKFMRRDDLVEKRLRSGELSHELLKEIRRLFGGTPRFLDQIRKVLRNIPVEELKKQLEGVKVPSGLEKGELQKKLDEYCEDIFTSRLYGYLSPESRRALSRAAVYGVAVNLEGLAAVTGEPAENLRVFVRDWQNYAFAYPDAGKGGGKLWAVYGLLRSWLLAQISPEDREMAHERAGDFLNEALMKNRGGDFGASLTEAALEARSHYLKAQNYEKAGIITNTISSIFMNLGLYDDVRSLNKDLLTHIEHPRPIIRIGQTYIHQGDYKKALVWYQRALNIENESASFYACSIWHGLASVDMGLRQYDLARKKFQKTLLIGRQIGSLESQAAAWRGLAEVDFRQGKLEISKKKFHKAQKIEQMYNPNKCDTSTSHNLASIESLRKNYDVSLRIFLNTLKIEQQQNDRHAEAMTFLQLGMLALRRNRIEKGLLFFVLSAIILKPIGHADFRREVEPIMNDLARRLKYTQEQLVDLHKEMAESYQRDRGWGLIEAAFADLPPEPDKV